jgi:hypothetical protein
MAARNHRIDTYASFSRGSFTKSPIPADFLVKKLLCEVRRHAGQQPMAAFCLSYEYLGGKHKQAIVRVTRPACQSCARSFARSNGLPIPPHKITLRQKVNQLRGRFSLWKSPSICSGFSDVEYVAILQSELRELVELVEVTYGL